MHPHVYYDPRTDALAIIVADGKAVESEEIAENILLGYDEHDKVVLIEVMNHAKELFADFIQKARLIERAG